MAKLSSDFAVVEVNTHGPAFDSQIFVDAALASPHVRIVQPERRLLRAHPLGFGLTPVPFATDNPDADGKADRGDDELAQQANSSDRKHGRKLLWGGLGQHSVTQAMNADSLWRLGYATP